MAVIQVVSPQVDVGHKHRRAGQSPWKDGSVPKEITMLHKRAMHLVELEVSERPASPLGGAC